MTLPEGRSRKDRPSVCLITPAFRRYALSEICLRQHREAIDALDNMGIDAQQVVIADDENLDIAKELGFLTVESPND